ncbi:MAG: hypothetical protein C0467_20870 [Planctomycetaceae bacterium]|nr:hypothetical protein [Planctomycetaceae bacterium]
MPRNTVVFRPSTHSAGGWIDVNPVFASRFEALGINSAVGFLELPGEVVSGHPDRHVMRVVLSGSPTAFYLKRQHTVSRRERLHNRLAGFGWSSRCVREAAILKELAAAALPAPQWVATGEDDRGRAFLLVQEVAGATDLRQVLSDNLLSLDERMTLANRLGAMVAQLHNHGLTTPDLTAKHVLVAPQSGDLTPIDWQSARRVQKVQRNDRVHTLAALHASVADRLASPRERLRVLRAALGSDEFATLARDVEREAAKIRKRRSIRDQRQPVVAPSAQRLVWVAEEAVCAVPDVAVSWPQPSVAAPFYGCMPGTLRVRLPDEREAVLIRGRSFAPFGRLRSALRGRPWRSPGVTLGRLLFHLERYGVPAPRLLAFGQRLAGPASAEWFALHEIQGEPLRGSVDTDTAIRLGQLLRQLHDAGCRLAGQSLAAFGNAHGNVCIRDITRVRLARTLTSSDRVSDLLSLADDVPVWSRAAVEDGYHSQACEQSRQSRPVMPVRPIPVALG